MFVDTSVLRAFAASGKFRLLRAFEPLDTTHRVLREVQRSAKPEVVAPVQQAVAEGWLRPSKVSPHPETLARISRAGGDGLSATDVEIVALALDGGEPLLIHDRRAIEVAEANGVACADLVQVLEALKLAGQLPTRAEMLEVVLRLETMDGHPQVSPTPELGAHLQLFDLREPPSQSE